MRGSVPSTPNSTRSEGSSDDECQMQEVVTTSCHSDDDSEDNAIVVKNPNDEEVPSFGNVSVMNSTDIHFGNKTIYQGPVTIKQFLYANGESGEIVNSALKGKPDVLNTNGIVNNGYVTDSAGTDKTNNVKSPNPINNNNDASVGKSYYILEKFPYRKVVIVSLVATVCISLLIVLSVLLSRHSSHLENNMIQVPSENPDLVKIPPYEVDQNLTLSSKLRIISRVEWVAQPPTDEPSSLPKPVPLVIIHHTASVNCSSIGQCVLQVRLLQDFHMSSRQWWDIGYNFLVGGDGSAYEGRGWTKEGAHLRGYNAKSIGIAFIGTFVKYRPPEIQFEACKKLIELGVEEGYISKNYKILAARQLLTTESPGMPVLEEIRKWPHWSPKP